MIVGGNEKWAYRHSRDNCLQECLTDYVDRCYWFIDNFVSYASFVVLTIHFQWRLLFPGLISSLLYANQSQKKPNKLIPSLQAILNSMSRGWLSLPLLLSLPSFLPLASLILSYDLECWYLLRLTCLALWF